MNASNAPAYIQFYPTLRCNFNCSFCFNRKLPAKRDVTIADFAKLASTCRKQGIKHIDILGGEPTLHPSLFQIVQTIAKNGLNTTISSNGSNPSLLFSLSDHFPAQSVRIGVSINNDALSDELHDYIVAHRPILKSVAAPREPVPPACRPYIELAGIAYYLLFMDLAESADLEKSISFEAFHRMLGEVKKAHPGIDGVFCGGFLPDTEASPELAHTRCPAGTTKLSVLPDGTVYPCYLLFRYKRFELGNILKDDFSDIWQHPVLDFFRRFEGNACPQTRCSLHDRCHGGCPAMSYMIHGRLDAPDPRCVHD